MPHRTLYLSDRLCEQLAGDTSSANLQDLIALGLAARQRRGVPVPLPTERLAIIERSSELRGKLAAADGELAAVANALLALSAQLRRVDDTLAEIDAAARADSGLAAPAPAAAPAAPVDPAAPVAQAVVLPQVFPPAPGRMVPAAALPNPFRTHTP